MKLREEQKEMIGFPPIIALMIAGFVVPIILADQGRNPWWLLLWVPFETVAGLTLAALHWWVRGGEK